MNLINGKIMKQIYIAFVIACVLKITLGCAYKSPDSSEEKAVKIVKTKAFSTKTEFDKLVSNKPEYNLGYDITIGMDFSWTTNYFDQYDNAIKSISFMLDNTGNEKILHTTINQYYSPKEHKLSHIKTEGDINEEIKYTRDDTGKLLEIIKYRKGEMNEKTVFTYNETGQRIKEDVYEKEGLKETNQFTYDLTDLGKSHIIKEIRTNFKPNYQRETDYKWSNAEKVISERSKYFENGKLLSDLTTSYNAFIGDIVTEEITEGYDASWSKTSADGTKKPIGGDPFKRVITRTLNENHDLVKYSTLIQDIDKNGQVIPLSQKDLVMGWKSKSYESKYTYNQRKDWIEILFTADFQKYLIIREIKYID